jgi:hypothetical protein
MRTLTLKQLEARKEKAARIARNAREEADRADFALQRATVEDLKGLRKMPMPTRRELTERIQELETENEELKSRLEEIGDLASTEDEDGENDEDSDPD